MDALQIPITERQQFLYLQARSLTKEIFLPPPLLNVFQGLYGEGKATLSTKIVSLFSALTDLDISSLVFRIGKGFRNSQQQKMLPRYKMQ